MHPGIIAAVPGYQLGHFIFDYWQIALFFLLCLINVWLIGWAYQRRMRNVEKTAALQLTNVVAAFAIAVMLSVIDSGAGQAIFLVGAALALVLWYRQGDRSQPFYLHAIVVAIGGLVGLGFVGISVAFSIICAVALASQRKPATS